MKVILVFILNFIKIVKNYSDYLKWKLIIAILKTMKSVPITEVDNFLNFNKFHFEEKEFGNLKRDEVKLLFPDDIRIIDPPIEN